jgi:Lrp/AsnC family transcriptional regulator, leucine-responsive regulatory protein
VLSLSGMSSLDTIDRQLVNLLQANDQASLGDLGRAVGLAPSSVKERVKRLTANGVIAGFHANIAPHALGLDLLAFIFVGWTDPATEPLFLDRVADEPAILECHHVTGVWNYLLKVRTRHTADIEAFLSLLKTVPGLQRTETLIVLSSKKETAALPVEPPSWSATGKR